MAKVVMLVEMDIPDGNLERIHPGGEYNWHLFKDYRMVDWITWSGIQRIEIKRIYAEDGQIYDINEVVNKP